MSKKILTIFILLILLMSSIIILQSSDSGSRDAKSKLHVQYYGNTTVNNRGVDPWKIFAKPYISYTPQPAFPTGEPPFFAYEIKQAYNLSTLENKGFMGQGMKVAIVDAYGDPYLNYDVASFNAYEGLPSANISVIEPYGAPSTYNQSWAIETSTDVEWFHAMAPLARIFLVIVPSAAVGYLQAGINYTIQNLSVNEISLSWGIPENDLGSNLVQIYNNDFKIAAERNIGIFAASGDQGAYDGTKTLTVNFPAADPYVTSVGGDSLYILDGKYGEYAWSGSGGGFSQYFATPYYQKAPGYSGTNLGIPDISMDANPNQGGVRVFAGAGCYVIGGTSLATPMAAASAIIISQYLHRNLGFFAPYLYAIANTNQYGKAIIPVYGGNNGYYIATHSWNPVTGLGSMNVGRLAMDLKSLLGPYGSAAYYGVQRNSTFTMSASVNISSDPNLSTGQNSYSGIGLFSNMSGGIILSGGLMVNSSGYYFYGEIGDHRSYEKLGSGEKYLNNTIAINFNISSISIIDGKQSFHFSAFPYDIYNSQFISYQSVCRPLLPLPQGINSSIYNLTLSSGKIKGGSLVPEGFFSIAPFNEGYLSMVSGSLRGKVVHFMGGSSPYMKTYPPSSNIFTIEQGQIVELNFTKNIQYTINGVPETGRTYKLSSGGSYNLTFTYNSTVQYYNILMPSFVPSNLYLQYNSSSYFSANFTGWLDYLTPINASQSLAFSRIGSESNITLDSTGFYQFNGNVPGKASVVRIEEKTVNVSMNISPADARVFFNGTNMAAAYPYEESLIPAQYNLSISAPYFKNSSASIKLIPDQNVIYAPFNLTGETRGSLITGYVTNEFYSALNNLNVPVSGVRITYNGSDYAYSDVNGQYSLWVPDGAVKLYVADPYFHNYTVNLNVSSNITHNITLYPIYRTLSKNPPEVTITRIVPLLFFTSYVSWSTNIGQDIKYFQIFYRQSGQGNWSVIRTSSSSSDVFINGIYPWNTYEVMVSAMLKDNVSINSTIQKISYQNPIYPLLSSLIYLGIILYIYVVINYFKKRKKRKEMEKTFFED